MTYQTIGEAARALNVSSSYLKRLKKIGADGFIGHRVNGDELTIWIKNNESLLSSQPAEDIDYWKCRREKALCLRDEADRELKEIDLEKAKRQSVDMDLLVSKLRLTMEAQKSLLVRRLVKELPTQLSAMAPEQVASAMSKLTNELIQEMARTINGIS